MTMQPKRGTLSLRSVRNLSAAWLASLPAHRRRALLTRLTEREVSHLAGPGSWWFWARDDQLPPPGDWQVWVFLGGRGAGKTRAGAEWLRAQMVSGCERAALVGPTQGDVREVMVDGPSGLIAIARHKDERPVFEASRRRLVWPNGAVALTYSAEEPDRLRGAQVNAAWCDEYCAWREPEAALAMLRFALRGGRDPRLVVTTTPQPLEPFKRLLSAQGTVVTRAPTRANAANLAPGFLAAMEVAYGHSALGRQELDGVIVEDRAGALWTRADLAAAHDPDPPAMVDVIVGLDPPTSVGAQADACGLIVAGATGVGQDRRAWVLADRQVQGLAREGWARAAADAACAFDAQAIVAEVNQGGAMVSEVLRVAAPHLPVRPVRAQRGKRARAEPIAALYGRGRVKHAGRFRELEDEMCRFDVLAARKGRGSPDRVDALVWALWALLVDEPDPPRLRTL